MDVEKEEEIEVVELNEEEENELNKQIGEEEVINDGEEFDEKEEGEEGEDEMGDDEIEIIPNDAFVTLTHHTGPVYSIDVYENTQTQMLQLVMGSGDDSASHWSVNLVTGVSNPPLFFPSKHSDSVTSIKFGYNGEFIMTGSMDSTVQVWKTSSLTPHHLLSGPSESIEWMATHPRGSLIMAGSADGSSWVWNYEIGSCLGVLSFSSLPVTCGNFTPDGKTIILGYQDGTLRIVDPKKMETSHLIKVCPVNVVQPDEISPVVCFDCLESKQLIATGSQDGSIFLINYSTGKVVGQLGSHGDSVESVRFTTTNPPLLATASLDGEIKLWDLNSNSLRSSFKHSEGVTKIVAHPTEPIFYSCSIDRTVKVWDARSCALVKQFQGHTETILDLQISKDGKYIFTSSDDNTVRIFSM